MGCGRRCELSLLLAGLLLLFALGCGSGSRSTPATVNASNSSSGVNTQNQSGASSSGTSTSSTTTSPTQTAAATQARFIYQVLNGFQVNPATGASVPVPGSVKALNGDPNGLAADPSGRFLYVSYQQFNAHGQPYGTEGVQQFRLDPATGAMSEISGSPLPNVSGPLAINQDGTFLYVGSPAIAGGNLTVYGIDQQTGALTLSLAQGPAFGPVMAMDPLGRFLFTAGGGVDGNEIGVDKLNPTTGAASAVSSTPATGPNFIVAIAVDPAGKYLFALGQSGVPAQPAVQSFAIDTDGTLTATSGPVAAGENVAVAGSSAAVDASGHFLYVVTELGLDVRGYAINSATGTISELVGSPFATTQVANPYSLWNAITSDRQAESVYLSSNNGPITYNVNSNTGALIAAPVSPPPASGNLSYFIAAVP